MRHIHRDIYKHTEIKIKQIIGHKNSISVYLDNSKSELMFDILLRLVDAEYNMYAIFSPIVRVCDYVLPFSMMKLSAYSI